MTAALAEIRRIYVEEQGEEPPQEFLQAARRELIRAVARDRRDAHRDIYDALADE